MTELTKNVKAIEMDGLVWGGSQLIAVGFGIKKLQINCVVEDDKVSIEDLQGQIESDEDHVQSTDVVSTIMHLKLDKVLMISKRLPCQSCRPRFR